MFLINYGKIVILGRKEWDPLRFHFCLYYDDCCFVVFKGNASLQFSFFYMIDETLPPVRCWLELGSSPLPKIIWWLPVHNGWIFFSCFFFFPTWVKRLCLMASVYLGHDGHLKQDWKVTQTIEDWDFNPDFLINALLLRAGRPGSRTLFPD